MMFSPQLRLIELATSLVGTHEVGGENKGPDVEAFQRTVDGKAQGEAWCLAFVQYCVTGVCDEMGVPNPLFPTEHCMTLWDKTHFSKRTQTPEPGMLILWQHYKDGKPTMQGHVGIVARVSDRYVDTIEGNTGSGKGVVREGDGVYARQRNLGDAGAMHLKGYIKVW